MRIKDPMTLPIGAQYYRVSEGSRVENFSTLTEAVLAVMHSCSSHLLCIDMMERTVRGIHGVSIFAGSSSQMVEDSPYNSNSGWCFGVSEMVTA
jgi:hypothetical protein